MISRVFTFIDTIDLSIPYIAAILLGICLSVVSMDTINPAYRMPSHYSYRIAYAAIALSLAWTFLYSADKNWQPWPPHLALILSVDYFLIIRWVKSRQRVRSSRDIQSVAQ